jgi:methionyl-tRNA formyltransferase
MDPLRIVFMGTPEFAVPTLEALINQGFNVVAVITAPDKPQGRGQKIVYSPVKECALKHNIPLLQPEKLKNPVFIEALQNLKADLQVVVAFRMLPEVVWTMPRLGTFNLHASLLPQYRGAAPINWAVINGEKETGVTTFFLKHDIDTGSILFQEKEPILADDDAGSLYERLMHRGAGLVVKTVQAISDGDFQAVPQLENIDIKHAPKIFKETCEIKWDQPADAVRNFIRGLSPHPAAWTTIEGKTFKLFKGEVKTTNGSTGSNDLVAVGEYVTDNRKYLHFKTSDGWYSVLELQPEGKKRMNIEDFFRGNKL